MLDKQDLQAIKELIDTSVNSAISASEARMKTYIDSSISASENRTHAYIEAEVMPKFQVLADGHQNLLDTLAPKSRVDALEDDVVFLKSVVKSLVQEVSDLQKA